MRRWHEPWGKEATYLRLVEGLKRIGWKNLIDCPMSDTRYASPSKYVYDSRDKRSILRRFCSGVIKFACCSMPLSVLLVMVIITCAVVLTQFSFSFKLCGSSKKSSFVLQFVLLTNWPILTTLNKKLTGFVVLYCYYLKVRYCFSL